MFAKNLCLDVVQCVLSEEDQDISMIGMRKQFIKLTYLGLEFV